MGGRVIDGEESESEDEVWYRRTHVVQMDVKLDIQTHQIRCQIDVKCYPAAGCA